MNSGGLGNGKTDRVSTVAADKLMFSVFIKGDSYKICLSVEVDYHVVFEQRKFVYFSSIFQSKTIYFVHP